MPLNSGGTTCSTIFSATHRCQCDRCQSQVPVCAFCHLQSLGVFTRCSVAGGRNVPGDSHVQHFVELSGGGNEAFRDIIHRASKSGPENGKGWCVWGRSRRSRKTRVHTDPSTPMCVQTPIPTQPRGGERLLLWRTNRSRVANCACARAYVTWILCHTSCIG